MGMVLSQTAKFIIALIVLLILILIAFPLIWKAISPVLNITIPS